MNDIALIRLKSPIKFNDKVKAAEISNKFVNAGVRLKVTGWGVLSVSANAIREFRLISLSNWQFFPQRVRFFSKIKYPFPEYILIRSNIFVDKF